MAATVEPYLSLVAKASDGRLKLPAFQRDWKWRTGQVILLFDSLRLGYPIGGFLHIKQNDNVDLSPREFRGATEEAIDKNPDFLVLDGQQRITAGLELFYGRGDHHYFLDLHQLHRLHIERKVDLASTSSIREFLANLEADDNYCIAKKRRQDPRQFLVNRNLLWTALLTDDIELDRSLETYKKAYPDRSEFITFLVGKNFRPSQTTVIPITQIDDDVSVEAISRIFSTLNSTGKMLTPFELVVSILYPNNINLAEDVEVAREAYPYYSKVDESGDILLQTIALFAGKDTKKASLPKTITKENYGLYRDDCVRFLNKSAKLLTEKIGLGLDQSSELLVYPVIFPPMAYVLKQLSVRSMSTEHRAIAERKIAKWFIGAVLSRRYQQSTHDKQARDKAEIMTWVDGEEADGPQWIKETFIPNLKASDPDSAIGKLLRSLVNARGVKDPYTQKMVGVGSGKQASAKHHIFPTRFVKNLSGWKDRVDTANLALNVMYTEQSTNASWLNIDPTLQFTAARNIVSEKTLRQIYSEHGISDEALGIMIKPEKTKDDFDRFIALREDLFANLFEEWGFKRPNLSPTDLAEDDVSPDE